MFYKLWKYKLAFRYMNALLLAPIMRVTGFRFNFHYRHGTTVFHAAVYELVDTVGANIKADGGAV